MTWAAVREALWPASEPRSEAQIDAEVEEEFAFHIEQLEREFIDAGLAPPESRTAALARFGNVRGLKSQCRRIALKERIMLRRIHLAFTILLALALVGTTLAAVQMQQHAARERDAAVSLQAAAMAQQQAAETERSRAAAVTSFLQSMLAAADPAAEKRLSVLDALYQAEQSIPSTFADQPEVAAKVREVIERTRQRAARDAANPRPISISSTVAPPVVFDLPADRTFTLRELVSKEPPRTGTQAVTTLYRRSDNEYRQIAAVTSHPDGRVEGEDAGLQPGDMVFVNVSGGPQPAAGVVDARKAGLVFLSGDFERPGVYAIPIDGRLTLRRLIVAAGGHTADGDFVISLFRRSGGHRSAILSLNAKQWRGSKVDEFLQDDDYVSLETKR